MRFETPPGQQMQVDFIVFRRGQDPLSAFVATLGYSRVTFAYFVTNERIETVLSCPFGAPSMRSVACPSGVGKTHIALALAYRAVMSRYKTRFITAAGLSSRTRLPACGW